MTQQRRDNYGTPFGDWLRRQPEIDSKKQHFIATDVDYIWKNYDTYEWMFFEEKRYNNLPTKTQINLYRQLDNYLKASRYYRGTYFIIFEKTTPDNGGIKIARLNHKELLEFRDINKRDFMLFLRFDIQIE